ncbi:MAG: type II toxin-antitoxin system YhaV family toxin [Candidatus Obscuribacterales bacterium]|nr:type II toxin-antitoxin system YhaV family toxin [Candidatus Obscuribacterales bacterium]
MEVGGWKLYQHPLFKDKYDKLLAEVEKVAQSQPATYESHKSTKMLKRITDLIIEEIPADPGHERFQQGKIEYSGAGYQHWKRAKFGKNHRYRLFFRYEQKQLSHGLRKVIIYAWINDESSFRKSGDKNDPYALFAKDLKKGRLPDSIEALLREAEEYILATGDEKADVQK